MNADHRSPLAGKPLIALAWFLSLLVLMAASCHQRQGKADRTPGQANAPWNRSAAEANYRLMQAELVLANSGKPYLVLDIPRRKLELKLKAAIVWDYPLQVEDDAGHELDEFAERFLGDNGKPVRPVAEKYLFAAQGKNPDTLLAIVSGALNIDPQLLQREVPSRFQIRWMKNLILDVSTDIVGKPKSKLKNTLLEVGQVLQKPFGEIRVSMKMNPDAALTFWRAVEVGVPTLLRPPS